MSDKAVFLRVGALLVVGTAAITGMLLFFSRDRVQDGRKVESYFQESVEGLDVGAPVKFRGVSLGQVTQIGLANVLYPDAVPVLPEGGSLQRSLQLVVVRYTIDPHKAGPVPDPARVSQLGLRARVASQGITGISYIELDFVDPKLFPAGTVPWTPRDQLLASMPSTISQVQDAGQAVLAKLQALDLQRLTDSARILLDHLDTQIAQADLPGLSAALKATAVALRDEVQGPRTQELLKSARDAVTRLARLADQLRGTAASADDGLADLRQRLDPLLRDAAAIAVNLRQTSENLRRDPASVLLGAPPPRPAAR